MKYEVCIDEAQRAYHNLNVKHKNQTAALEHAIFLSVMCPNVNFVIIKGPTGVGKTHLLHQLESSINARYSALVESKPSTLPCISTIAVADGAKKFGWKRFWTDALRSLHDPFVHSRPELGSVAERIPRIYPNESISTSVARSRVEEQLKLRGTKVWIVDEAQHMLLGGTAGEPGDQFDVLKSVSQTTGLKVALCGTYQLAELLAYSGQVMRRSATVDLKRYDYTSKSDLIALASVANALFKALPLTEYPDPKANCEELYLGTLGCIGVLKDWIAQAWALAAFRGTSCLTMKHLRETRLPAETLREMNQEILAGEAQGSTELKSLHRNGVSNAPTNEKRERTVSRHRKPGVRNPARDPVGSSQ